VSPMTGRAIIAGGSIGGLFAAAALLRAGWDVRVYERSPVPLAGRGAGIVTHPELAAALEAVGADTSSLGVDVHERVAYDMDGARVAAFDFHQVVTSWDRVYQILLSLMPEGTYVLDRTAAGYEDKGSHVTCLFSDGRHEDADLLVGTDGFRSAIRGQMLPGIQPEYSGYVVWRTLAAEADLPEYIRADIFKTFGFFIPSGTQIIGYPIAGPANDLRPGHLRYNFVWYSRETEDHLKNMLTDAYGTHHAISIPPPMIRDDVIAAMYEDARTRLPGPFRDILAVSDRPFFTPIYDHHSPIMGRGRVALAGDAACVARPHVGMGVTKAAGDALALADAVTAMPVPEAVTAYSAARVEPCRIAFETSRRLGGYIFGGDSARNLDGRSHPNRETVMRETAVVPAALTQFARNSS
jgi:2-polyprenyl-6-methoxyphenol hydroxylase-like FAD-dependent oxidoreductase